MTVVQLRTELEPEPWGYRLQWMRTKAGYKNAKAVAAAINELRLIDFTIGNHDILRLENFVDAPNTTPKQARMRTIAYMLCLFYGYDPRVISLSMSDLPARLQLMGYEEVCRRIHPHMPGGRSDQQEPSTTWIAA